jgi:cell division protein FtsB
MRMCGHNKTRRSSLNPFGLWRALSLLVIFFGTPANFVSAQAISQENLSQEIQKLTAAMARTQAQLEQSQRQLDEMRKQLTELQRQMAQSGANAGMQSPSGPVSASSSSSQAKPEAASAAIQDIRERQAMQESQIATQEQSKVESESKYPVKVTGLLLLNGFVNTGAVDMAATPTVALPGSGSTGASVRQTVLGIDARGPHLFGARSYADLWVDFDGSPASDSSTTTYSGYYNANTTLLRLRTAHAGLQWEHTEAYFSLDHPIFSPDAPTSLTAVAIPALAWSGNLWTWNPQVGITQDFGPSDSRGIRLQAALIDVGDAPLSPPPPTSGISTATPPSSAEQSRWPGVEARVELRGPVVNNNEDRNHFGVGGYFAPHYSSLLGQGFDSWAGTLDARLLLPARLEFTGSFYRGQALGGLGGGAYKDFAYKADSDSTGYYFRPLDDVGGWTQLKERLSERLEFNAAFGIDNAFADELRRYAVSGGTTYQNLARNRTYTGNVIYSPSAYLQFSLEYRHIESSPVIGLPAGSNIIGLGAGYKF